MERKEFVVKVLLCTVMVIMVCFTISPRLRNYFKLLPPKQVSQYPFVDRLKDCPYSDSVYDGIDVSKHQGIIKWDEVAQNRNIKFVYIRATFGKNHPDKYYKINVEGAKSVGLKIGSYHFLTSRTSVDEQFEDFINVASPSQQDLLPMIDVEDGYLNQWSREQLQDSLTKFSKLIVKYYGKAPVIYSSEKFYNDMLAPRFNDHFLYIAKYANVSPKIIGGNKHDIWQYSEKGHIKGIGEYVDLSMFAGGVVVDDIMV